jgi:formate C-acetyltransferase
MRGVVFDIQRFSLHDGPGIRTTVFLKECPLRCTWCQNPEGLAADPELLYTASACAGCRACAQACPRGAHQFADGQHAILRDRCRLCGACAQACLTSALRLTAHTHTVRQVLDAVLEDAPYYAGGGGVTLSGGEPLLQPAFAAAVLAACRAHGIGTAVDSSLCAPWEAVADIVPLADVLLVDIKHLDDGTHRAATGVGNARILDNLRRLAGAAVPLIVRVPVIPGFNDFDEAIADIARFAAGLGTVQRLELLPHHRLGDAKRAGMGLPADEAPAPLGAERLAHLRQVAAAQGVCVAGVEPPRPQGISLPADLDARLDAIRARKHEHTARKRADGPRDVDDWGQIPLGDLPFAFSPESDRPDGKVLGPRACGANFRRFLAACPTYVDPNSSLLGGYYLTFNEHVTGWDPAHYWTHLAPDIRKYGIIHGIDGTQHFLPDVTIGLELGWGGLLAKTEHFRAKNPARADYYDGLAEFVRGVQDWIARHVEAARAMAADEGDPLLRDNLATMADLNERLVGEPPTTFVEACQWLAWYQMAKRAYIGGGSLGRLDVALLPYYARDRAAGRLTDAEAVFHLACLLVKDSHYIQLGGMDADGRDETNPLSFLFLEAAHVLGIPANLAVMVHEHMDARLLRRAVELLLHDRLGIPRFAGQDAVIAGMVHRGFPLEDARRRVQGGCHWFCIPGREYGLNDVIKINLAKVFEVALDELLAAGRARPSVRRLWRRFHTHLRCAVDVVAAGIDHHMAHQAEFYPELALSLLSHGPIEQGVDASAGSLQYTNIGVDAAGLATVADAFAGIEQRIEVEGSLTWDELCAAAHDNWWRDGKARLSLSAVPGFGRGGTRGDAWAERVVRAFSARIVCAPTPNGWQMSPGLFSWASTIPMGRQVGATPDGRGAGEPISFGANPNPGRLHGGPLAPTALATAVARVQPGYGNPAPLQLDVDPGPVIDDEAVDKFATLIRTHFALGGTLINANILDRETMLDACRRPEAYPDLVVRVTGFSAYFASLSDDFRRLVYERVVEMEHI